MYKQTTKTNFLQPKPSTDCDSNHDFCAAMVRELKKLNQKFEKLEGK